MPLTAVQEKLKTIPDEYMDEVYNYLELLQYKILYKKQHDEKNCRVYDCLFRLLFFLQKDSLIAGRIF